MIARALTIAGSDSSGGAGLQADLKTFTVFGVFGMSAVTAVTAQNTLGVSAIQPVLASVVRAQIDDVVSDIGVDAVKTGMLANVSIVRVVAQALRTHRVERVVVDPVMVAHNGAALLADDALDTLYRELLPLAMLVTPNVPEAERLTGLSIRSIADMRSAARALLATGARACLVKGGHLQGAAAVDVLDDGAAQHEFVAERVTTPHTHGTGCQLSAAITANLALGRPLPESIDVAKQFITMAIRDGLAIGRGAGPANPLAWGKGGLRSS